MSHVPRSKVLACAAFLILIGGLAGGCSQPATPESRATGRSPQAETGPGSPTQPFPALPAAQLSSVRGVFLDGESGEPLPFRQVLLLTLRDGKVSVDRREGSMYPQCFTDSEGAFALYFDARFVAENPGIYPLALDFPEQGIVLLARKEGGLVFVEGKTGLSSDLGTIEVLAPAAEAAGEAQPPPAAAPDSIPAVLPVFEARFASPTAAPQAVITRQAAVGSPAPASTAPAAVASPEGAASAIRGTLIDGRSGEPLRSARVVMFYETQGVIAADERDGKIYPHCFTGSGGEFSLQFDLAYLARHEGPFHLSVDYPGGGIVFLQDEEGELLAIEAEEGQSVDLGVIRVTPPP